MASAGPNAGGTFVSDSSGARSWNSPGNAVTSDDVRTFTGIMSSTNITTDVLKITNFGFAIPSGATIDGITVDVERSKSGAGTLRDLTIQLIVADALTGDNKADTGTN